MSKQFIEINFHSKDISNAVIDLGDYISIAIGNILRSLKMVDGFNFDGEYTAQDLLRIISARFGKKSKRLAIYKELKRLKKYHDIYEKYYQVAETIAYKAGASKAILSIDSDPIVFAIFLNDKEQFERLTLYGSSGQHEKEIKKILKNDFCEKFKTPIDGEEE